MGEKKDKYREPVIVPIGLVTFIAVFAVVSGIIITVVLFVSDRKEYQAADEKQAKYEGMADSVILGDDADDIQLSGEEDDLFEEGDVLYDDDGKTLGDYFKEERGKRAAKTDKNLRKRIDFDSLGDLLANDDAGSWLYIPGTGVDYVVMTGDEEEPFKYLWKDPYGDASSTGSLFVADTGEIDDHLVVYGHRLRNHDLYFGALLPYQESDYAMQFNVAYLYDEERVTRYNLYAVVNGLETDIVYYYPYERHTEDYEYLIGDITEKAAFRFRESFDTDNRMLVLSTCSGEGAGQPERLYLVFEEDVFLTY